MIKKGVNQFIEIGAKSFPNTPFEQLYDLEIDPFQKNNLANNKNYIQLKNKGVYNGCEINISLKQISNKFRIN